MGSGASMMMVPMGGGGGKEPSQEEIQAFAKELPPELIDVLKRVVAKAEDGGGTSSGSEVKTSGKKWAAIDKFGNSDKASEMQRAIFIWDEETCQKHIKEFLKDKEPPEKMTGAQLVMEDVAWKSKEDQEKWTGALVYCAKEWMWSQVDAEVPFDPVDQQMSDEEKNAILNHCVYLWDEKAADAFLEKLKYKKLGLTGKKLMDHQERLGALSMDDSDKVLVQLANEAVLFMKDIVKFVVEDKAWHDRFDR
ncbi:unnamed protein product [Durusdinium trenchii]|uniref:Uncharacterized protein n=1 Tax=Durusdinium trenchii TaxID=1381693 RepID=A0ABP0ITT7_9DINO